MPTITALKTVIRDQRIERGSQSVEFVEVSKTSAGDTIRVRVYSDAYQNQSWGRVERWDGGQWQEVATISGQSLTVQHGLYVVKDVTAARFTADVERLKACAAAVLG